jgi:predicted GIY-YIG superfamily endonuclease
MDKQPAVYILASGYNGTLYIGVTSNLVQRIWQHKNDMVVRNMEFTLSCITSYVTRCLQRLNERSNSRNGTGNGK